VVRISKKLIGCPKLRQIGVIAIYNGLCEVKLDERAMADFYQNKNKDNTFCLVKNQYLLIKDENENIVDQYKWTGNKLVSVSFRTIDTECIGKVKPKNVKQQCYFDMLDDKTTTVKCVIGKQGTGKSYIATAWALSKVQRGDFEKLVVLRNNPELVGTKAFGFLPGGTDAKLLWLSGHIRNSVTQEDYDSMCACGEIELFPLNFIRGKSWDKSILYLSEAQNTSVELMRVIIGRVGEGSILVLDGDMQQTDLKIFSGDSNGLLAVSRSLAGNELFSIVELTEVERSRTSALAELIK
jgi:PhoH-like ATPase